MENIKAKEVIIEQFNGEKIVLGDIKEINIAEEKEQGYDIFDSPNPKMQFEKNLL